MGHGAILLTILALGPPAPGKLPRYDAPIAVAQPAPSKPSFDSRIPLLISTGSVLLTGGAIVTLLTSLEWKSSLTFGFESEVPLFSIGFGVACIATGAALIGGGVSRHKRWKASQKATARVQLQPMIG